MVNLRRESITNIFSFIIFSTGYATIKGNMALNKLLKGSKPLPNVNKMYRDFQKPGNYAQALSDFYSVKPTSVRSIKMRNGVSLNLFLALKKKT